MIEISKEIEFSAAHHLRDYVGKCENLHGHNWLVRVHVRGEKPLSGGMLIDFGELKQAMRQVIEKLDHKDLNSVPPFDKLDPSSELIAEYICKEISLLVDRPGAKVNRVEVWESHGSRATYYRDE